VTLVIALAAYEGGPHAAGDTRLATVFGAQAMEPPAVQNICNGRELEVRSCPKDRYGRVCGDPYKAIKPVAPGVVKNKLSDNDRRECNRFPNLCPVIYSQKEVMEPCTPVVQQEEE
jgi:hypothetical protein